MMWNSNHVFTLVDKVELDKAKAANDSNVNSEGESVMLSTPEYGLQMTQVGYDAYLCNIRPSLFSPDGKLCLIRGCHVLHAKEYLTIDEAQVLINEWEESNGVSGD